MAGLRDWMNPNPQTAHMDMLLNNPAAEVLPERMQTREVVEPRWNLPWQGDAEFITEIGDVEEVPQTQRPAMPTEKFPAGERIASNFKAGFRRAGDLQINQEILKELTEIFAPPTTLRNRFRGTFSNPQQFHGEPGIQDWYPRFRSPSSRSYTSAGQL